MASMQGYIAEHRDIELLKLKSYTVSTEIDDKVFTMPEGQAKLTEIVEAMCGFVSISRFETRRRFSGGNVFSDLPLGDFSE